MPLARGARVFRSSRSWAPPPLLAALMLVVIGQAAGISLSKRFHPTRNAFGPNCTFPETATCHPGYTGSSLDHVMGMYASWNTCAMPIRPAQSHNLVEVARLIHPNSRWKEGYSLGWFPNKTGLARKLPCNIRSGIHELQPAPLARHDA